MTKKEMYIKLKEASEAYYNSDQLIMSDEEFDKLAKEYEELYGEKFDTRTSLKKNNKKIKVIEVEHKYKNLLGTIDNKFANLEEFKKWITKISEENDNKINGIFISLKYDGNSLSIEYDEKGNCKLALTRGENNKGADLTPLFKDRKLNQEVIDYIETNLGVKYRELAVRYEAIIKYDKFDELNKIKEENNDNSYKNPRTTVTGLMSNSVDGIKYKDYIDLIPLSVESKDFEKYHVNNLEKLELIEKISPNGELFTDQSNAFLIYTETVEDYINEITSFYNKIISKRENLGFMIDGIIIDIMDRDIRSKLGRFATGSPKWQCAIKFPYMQKETTVKDIVFEASPNGSGKITPSVIVEPVIFNGATMQKISLANYKRFKSLKIGVGTKGIVEYRNDTLSYFTKLDIPENDNIKPIPFTNKCPVCNGNVKINKNDKNEETFVYCDNPECSMKIIGKINRYTTSIGIKGIEVSTIEKLYSAGLLENIPDIYKLKFKDVSKVEGLGELSAINIIDAIKENIPNDYDILAGLGITNLGQDTSKLILRKIPFEKLLDMNYIQDKKFKEELILIEGIGPKMAERIPLGLIECNSILNEIVKEIKMYNKTKMVVLDENQKLYKFVTTGDPDTNYFKDRFELKKFLEDKGHKLISAVSKKTDYLITETPNSGTVKNKKAQELNIPIITTKQLMEEILK